MLIFNISSVFAQNNFFGKYNNTFVRNSYTGMYKEVVFLEIRSDYTFRLRIINLNPIEKGSKYEKVVGFTQHDGVVIVDKNILHLQDKNWSITLRSENKKLYYLNESNQKIEADYLKFKGKIKKEKF